MPSRSTIFSLTMYTVSELEKSSRMCFPVKVCTDKKFSSQLEFVVQGLLTYAFDSSPVTVPSTFASAEIEALVEMPASSHWAFQSNLKIQD